MTKRGLKKAKQGVLATLLAGGILLGTSCTVGDIWQNVVAGALTYVKNTTTNVLTDSVPLP